MGTRKEANARVLAAIDDLVREQGYPPTLREISRRVGIYYSVVHYHVMKLREAGLLYAPEARIARGIRLTDAGRAYLDAGSSNGDQPTVGVSHLP